MIDSLVNTLFNIVGQNVLLFHALLGLITAVLIIASGKVVKLFLNSFGRVLISKTNTQIDDEIMEIVLSRIIALSTVTGVYFGIKQVRLGLTQKNEYFLTFLTYADIALYLVTVIVLVSVMIRIARKITTHTIRSIAEKHKNDDFNQSIAPLANRVVTFIILTITIIVVLEHFGQSVTSILTIVGAGSLALGLAAQDTISNMISGFIIMLDRPFRVGDRVKIPSGEVGDVYEIGLRSTKILDFDNNLLIVPNNELIKTKIVNYGYPAGEIRVVVDIGVSYGSNIASIKKLLVDLAKKHPLVMADPVPEAFLMNFGDSSLQFRLVCRVSSFQDQFNVAENLRVRVYEEFVKQGIEIPFPQRVVHHTYEKNNALQTSSKRKKISR